jgi:signal transduction histidine kinase
MIFIKIVCQRLLFCAFLSHTKSSSHAAAEERKLTYEQEIQVLQDVLNCCSEKILLIDPKANLKFLNKSLSGIVEISSNLKLEELSRWFMDLKYITSNTDDQASSLNSLTWDDSYISRQLQNSTSLMDVFSFYIQNERPPRDMVQKYTSTFHGRFYHQKTKEWHNMEIKANLLLIKEERHLLLSIKDLTEIDRKTLSTEKEKVVYRDNLIASFSHELRTPLNSNLGFLEQSLESPLVSTEAKEKFIRPALISGRLLSFIVSDILDYSLILAHGLRLDIKDQDLRQNVETCVDLIKPKLSQKGLNIKVSYSDDVPVNFYTDFKRLTQILVNLLNNAIQFTMKGEIEVNLTMTEERNLMITVKDTGIGMDTETQRKLQNSLDQEELNERVNENSVGIGLGLFISNKLTKMLNPKTKRGLSFSATKNKGSIFCFEIKNQEPKRNSSFDIDSTTPRNSHKISCFEIDQQVNINMKVRQYNTHSLKNKFTLQASRSFSDPTHFYSRVLIVDDEIFNINVIENFCKGLGLPTEKALNGQEAVEKLKECSNDGYPAIRTIFMDINMPVMDGYQASRKIYKMVEEGEIEDVTIIGVTAYIAWDKIEKGYRSGMTEVLNKPVSKETLVNVLNKYRIL